MPFVMNMVIMCQVHHLRTEKEMDLQIVPKGTPIDTNQIYPII